MTSLPNIANDRPKYNIKIPTTQEEIKFSPYTKNQEKVILIASQEDDNKSLINTLESIVENCTKKQFDTIIDFAFIATHIKSKSHGGEHEFVVKKCKNCDHENIKIKVDEITDCLKLENENNLKTVHTVNENLKLQLVPTKLDMLKNINYENTTDNIINQLYSLIAYSVSYVVYKEKVYKDFTHKELIENIISNLTSKEIDDINKEIGKLITMYFEIKYTCPKCEKSFVEKEKDFLL